MVVSTGSRHGLIVVSNATAGRNCTEEVEFSGCFAVNPDLAYEVPVLKACNTSESSHHDFGAVLFDVISCTSCLR